MGLARITDERNKMGDTASIINQLALPGKLKLAPSVPANLPNIMLILVKKKKVAGY